MKTKILTVLVALFFTQLVKGQEVTVKGKAPVGVEQLRLMAFNGESLGYDQFKLATVKDGQFEFNWTFDQPNLYKVMAGEKALRLAISKPSNITLSYLNDNTLIDGSDESKEMLLFDEKNGALQAKHFGELKKEADKAMASGDRAALEKIQEKSAVAIQEFLVEFRAAIVDMGASPGGYYALQSSDFTKEIDFIKKRLLVFQQEIPDSPVTKALEKQVYRSTALAIGAAPPAISATDREGKAFSLGQYQGKVLLVDFWAAWCRACRIENPQFVELYGELEAKGLEIVSISQDKERATWEAAIAKDGVGIWRHVQDADGSISELYSVSSLPQNVVIGKDGKIIARNVTAKDLEKLLAAHL